MNYYRYVSMSCLKLFWYQTDVSTHYYITWNQITFLEVHYYKRFRFFCGISSLMIVSLGLNYCFFVMYQNTVLNIKQLTLILLETKVTSLWHHYRARPACAHPCSLTRSYIFGWPTSKSHIDIPKTDNWQFQKLKVDYSIQEIQQLLVKLSFQ